MKTTIDGTGRIVVPKALREALGLSAGSIVDISQYGSGLQIVPSGRTAKLKEVNGNLIASGNTKIDDETVFGLVDIGRR